MDLHSREAARRRERRGAEVAWGLGEMLPTEGVTGAWEAAVSSGLVLEVDRVSKGGRGWAVGVVPRTHKVA